MDRVTFVDHFIKFYPGKEQVDMSVEVSVPGTWFNNMSAEEKRKHFTAVAVEFDPLRVFGHGSAGKKAPAIRFQVIEDVEEDPDHPGYWMKLDTWNRYRHDTYKEARAAEAKFIPPDRSLALVVAPDEEGEVTDKSRALVYQYVRPSATIDSSALSFLSLFDFVSSGEHTVTSGKSAGKKLKMTLHKCKIPGCTKLHSTFKVVSGSTGALFRHLKDDHPEKWVEVRQASPHSKLQVTEDGSLVTIFSFEDAFEHHVRYVLWLVLDLEHFEKSKSKAMRVWIAGLQKQYRPPCRRMCVRLTLVIAELVLELLHALLKRNPSELGSPHMGGQTDLWSTRNAEEAFAAIRVSLVALLGGKLVDMCPLLAFTAFPENRHTGPALGRFFVFEMKNAGQSKKSNALLTQDGASNNKKAAELESIPNRVCSNHDLARAILIGLGMGGEKHISKNPVLRTFLSKLSTMVSSFTSSIITNKRLEQSQLARGVSKHRLQRPARKHAVRWSGWLRVSRKNRILEKDIKVSLTGETDGVCGEEAAQVESTDVEMLIEAVDMEEGGVPDTGLAETAIDDGDDVDQVEANYRAGKEFPLAHRCISLPEWTLNSQLESVLTVPHEVSVDLQRNSCGLDDAFVNMKALSDTLSSKYMEAVSGAGEEERWEQKLAATLPKELRLFWTLANDEVRVFLFVLYAFPVIA
ncbi:hypothetical protein CYMTET_42221 [Cymbomonas tetramitiformis]|uniref:Uncharacterized protein n=1 Tax=Cymbomonas tetramitiformis TaxID=36881 RepID=A0AAE0C4K5_9CHLO|nr:hypothetical protein CYMTET_42221 [Cymbomonas tetramitiformis]